MDARILIISLVSTEPELEASTSKDPCQICRGIDQEHALAVAIKTNMDKVVENRNKEEEQKNKEMGRGSNWRKQCGCMKTSDKVKELLKLFPAPPPPAPPSSPASLYANSLPGSSKNENTCVSAYCMYQPESMPTFLGNRVPPPEPVERKKISYFDEPQQKSSKSQHAMSYLVYILQLSMTTTALMIYYIIYCYMQLIYCLLRSVMFFHNADGPMKITIGVVTVTSIVVAFNLMIRMERMVGLHLRN